MTARNFFACTLLLAVPLPSAAAEEWKPASGPLATRWTKEVRPEKVWPEYPRPQMVRQQWTNLNGLWDYAITAKEAEKPAQWDGEILVPFCVESALSGVMKPVTPEQFLWYRRAFKTTDLDDGQRMLLHFGAVDWHATVWLNGKKLGEHKGGFAPFHFEITDFLQKEENELVVRVWDPTDQSFQPRGKQVLNPRGIYYTAVTGIWQTVWLETVPQHYIEKLKIVPDFNAGQVSVQANVAGADSKLKLHLTVRDDGQTVAQASGRQNEPITLILADVKSWSPAKPHLYDLVITYGEDKVTSYFAMRKIEVRKDAAGVNRLFLNNEPLFQFGPLDQGWWPDGLYTPPTDAAVKYDVEVTKKLGMNLVRKHVKIEHPRFYYWADKLGLLVWQDMPGGNLRRGGGEGVANFDRELRSMIDTVGNHPCIVMWVVFNEAWGQHDTPRYVELVENLDPSRLVNGASGWKDEGVGDVRDVHKYPGPASAPLEENRAVVLGEFGGLGLQVEGHMWRKDENWGYRSFKSPKELSDAYLGLLQKLRPLIDNGLAAAVYTQTSDVEIEVNGLMTYDRDIIKLDAKLAAAAAKKLYTPAPQGKVSIDGVYVPRRRPPTDGRIGSNYTPAYAVNQVQFWHDFRPDVVEKELAAARKHLGVSTLRVFLHDINFIEEKQVLLENLETFLAICDKHGIQPGFVFFDGCHRHEGIFLDKPTEPISGYHNGRWAQSPQARDIDESKLDKFKPYVQEIIKAHRADRRVLFWEIHNEPPPGDEYRDRLKRAGYAWAKEVKPIQPVLNCEKGEMGWADCDVTDIVDAHVYSNAHGPLRFLADVNPKKGTVFTEAGARWKASRRNFGGPIDMIHWLKQRRRAGQSTPGMYLCWELMVGNSNTRWHWIDKPGAAEPEIPWCGLLWPDGSPVSLAEAEAVREYTTGESRALFFEDFESHSDEVWKTYRAANTSVRNAATLKPGTTIIAGDQKWDDYVVEGQVSIRPSGTEKIEGTAGMLLRVHGPGNSLEELSGYAVTFNHKSLRLSKIDNGQWKMLKQFDLTKLKTETRINEWSMLRIEANGPRIRVWFNRMHPSSDPDRGLRIDYTDQDEPHSAGAIGATARRVTAMLDNIVVVPIDK